jgi:drug/metabolite transporter (DMT)-like permease
MRNRKVLGNVLLLLTAIIWGTAFAAQRAGMESIEPLTFTAARMWPAALAVGFVALVTRRRSPTGTQKTDRKQTILGGICCGFFLVSATIFQQIGIVYTTAGKAGFITAMYMLLVPVVNFVLFGKKNTWLVWLAVLIGVAGMYLLCITEGFSLTKGDALVCICAVLFTGHILCIDYFVRTCNPVEISAVQFFTAAVVATAAAFLAETPTWEKIAAAAIPILYCGLVSGGIGYTLQIVAQKFTDPTVASLLLSMEAVFAVLSGALLLNERMSGRELAGCAVMFIAILLVQVPLPRKAVNM